MQKFYELQTIHLRLLKFAKVRLERHFRGKDPDLPQAAGMFVWVISDKLPSK